MDSYLPRGWDDEDLSLCLACDGSGLDGSHEAALYYADRGELSPCPACDGTGRTDVATRTPTPTDGG